MQVTVILNVLNTNYILAAEYIFHFIMHLDH